jgi:hypothetical protein
VKCRCVVRERLLGQVKSGQVKCSRVPDPVPVPIQVPVPDPVAVPETQLSTNEAAGHRCFQEPEGAGHPAGIMPFDRLEGVWPGRERLSLCNAATGNERSLRRGRRRRVRGGGGRGGWLWAARRSLLAAGCCWLSWGSLSPANWPWPWLLAPSLSHSQHTMRCQPASACLLQRLRRRHCQRSTTPEPTCQACAAAVQATRPLQSSKCSISGNPRLLVRRGPRLCLGRRLDVPGRVHARKCLDAH